MRAQRNKLITKLQFALVLSVILLAAFLPGAAFGITADGEIVAISFGDSYSSGEGNAPYYGQDGVDKYTDEDWLAHRSKASWPGRLEVDGVPLASVKHSNNKEISRFGVRWYFYASSGAVANNIYAESQSKEGQKWLTYEHFGGSGSEVKVQLKEAVDDLTRDGVKGNEVDYVTMTIGGNDVGFAKIVTDIAVRNGFVDRDYLQNALNIAWYNFDKSDNPRYKNTQRNRLDIEFLERRGENEEAARDQIIESYVKIREYFPQAKIIIAGYPTLLDDDRFEAYLEHQGKSGFLDKLYDYFLVTDMSLHGGMVGFADWEAWLVNQNVRDFNSELEKLVTGLEDEGFSFVPVQDAFDGHESEYLNGVMITGKQDLALRQLPPVSAGSVHPKEKGLQAYADEVQKQLNTLLEQSKENASPESFGGKVSHGKESDAAVGVMHDISLVLDISGSMEGEPLNATKQAASAFVDLALDNNAQTALVAYDDEAEVKSGLSASGSDLKAAIGQLTDGGGTNMESGLAAANSLLSSEVAADRRYIVLMSDGQPNSGKTEDELVSYAQMIRDPDGDGKDDVIIYALGFNEDAAGQELLRAIASEGCYYSVHDAQDLTGFFQDMADSINGVRFMYVRIACPVDVTVAAGGETLASAEEGRCMRTAFGTLSFEEGEDGDEEDPVKVLRLREGESYEIVITGTGDGTMDYAIGFIDDEGLYSDFRTFSEIDIASQTVVRTLAEAAEETTLTVDRDGDGTIDETYLAGPNEEGQPVDNSWVARVVVASFMFIGLALLGLLIWRNTRRIREGGVRHG